MLMHLVQEKPDTKIQIDLESKLVKAAGYEIRLDMPEAGRKVLVDGTWTAPPCCSPTRTRSSGRPHESPTSRGSAGDRAAGRRRGAAPVTDNFSWVIEGLLAGAALPAVAGSAPATICGRTWPTSTTGACAFSCRFSRFRKRSDGTAVGSASSGSRTRSRTGASLAICPRSTFSLRGSLHASTSVFLSAPTASQVSAAQVWCSAAPSAGARLDGEAAIRQVRSLRPALETEEQERFVIGYLEGRRITRSLAVCDESPNERRRGCAPERRSRADVRARGERRTLSASPPRPGSRQGAPAASPIRIGACVAKGGSQPVD